MDDFRLEHREEKIIAIVTIEGKTYEKDVSDYLLEEDETAKWLFYRRKNRLNR